MTQKVSLNEIQKEIDKWILSHGGYWPPLAMLSAVIEEIGELAREINHLEGYKPKKSNEAILNIGEELADLLFALFCIANHYKVDLTKEMKKILYKYNNRDSNRFH